MSAATLSFVAPEARREPCSWPRCGHRPMWEGRVDTQKGRRRYPAFCTPHAIRWAKKRRAELPLPGRILQAMRAEALPEGSAGSWRVRRLTQSVEASDELARRFGRGYRVTDPGVHTGLECTTWSTLNRPHGELVMLDSWAELRSHLAFVLRARGEVLVTGLGLGCVVRGLLLRDEVTRIDVVERERDVIRLVAPHLPSDSRVRIHRRDAMTFVTETKSWGWDCAWHDLWSHPDRDEDHLANVHTKLFVALRDQVRVQGAWAYPRWARRMFRERGLALV